MNRRWLISMFAALCAGSFSTYGRDADITLHSTVSGTREQPKVMYILPWQRPSNTHIEQEINAPLEDALFEALDREEFVRELKYQAMINAVRSGGGDGNAKIVTGTE